MIVLEDLFEAVLINFDDIGQIDIRSCKYTESSTKILKYMNKKTRSNDTRNQKQLYKLWNKQNVQHEVKERLARKSALCNSETFMLENETSARTIGTLNTDESIVSCSASKSGSVSEDWEEKLLYRLKDALSNVSVSDPKFVDQFHVNEILALYNQNSMETPSETNCIATKSLIRPTHTEEQIKIVSWKNMTKGVKSYGIYYNFSRHSENIDMLYSDYIRKCVVCETSSSLVRQHIATQNVFPAKTEKIDSTKAKQNLVTPTYQLSRKLSWVVSTTLGNQKIYPTHHKFATYKNVLTKVVKRLYLDIRSPNILNIDRLLSIAKSNIYWVLQGESADEIYFNVKKRSKYPQHSTHR